MPQSGLFKLVKGIRAIEISSNIDKISFTGSTRAGALISQNAAKDFKRVSLELGGKGANIIFKDADPKAIERGALRCFRNSGQSCNAPTRMLVEKSIYSEAINRVKKYTSNLKVGDPNKEGNHIGPVVSNQQYEKVQKLIKKQAQPFFHNEAGIAKRTHFCVSKRDSYAKGPSYCQSNE